MTLLFTRICDEKDFAPALQSGADAVYLRLDPGSGIPGAIPNCHFAIEIANRAAADHLLRGQDWPETLIGIIPAPDQDIAASLAACGFKNLMLAPETGRLLKTCEPEILHGFISFCHAQNLKLGLGGQIEAPDIPRLLLLEPDFLVFPSDPPHSTRNDSPLDRPAIALARDLIASFDTGSKQPFGAPDIAGMAKRPQERRNSMVACIETGETDRLFVHDLILPAAIGAYKSETAGVQRVRFNVDLAVRRQISRGQDMRDIFSYDLIVDTIKLILGRGHVQFIETLAEEVASAMLAHSRVANAKVRVEKLDILQACVGIEIFREKLSESAAITSLFPGSEIKTGGR